MADCNPCSTGADCESLPSALDNFIKDFFGEIEKTYVDGKWTWILPCDLDTGIPGNPRQDGEGLACYFKRLFEDGLTGIEGPTGPTGPTGPIGLTGQSAYSTNSVAFTVPNVGDSVPIVLANASWIAVGSTVFVETSGYYKVVGKSGNTLTAQLTDSTGVTGVIPTGKLVQAAGLRGSTGTAQITDGANIGSLGEDVYQEKVGTDLVFRRIAATNGLRIDLVSGYDPSADSYLQLSLEDYVPSTPSDWASGPPTSLAEAIDRLAAAAPGA